ncbi:MAG: hypothetical protein C0523_06015 [Cytophaga sp.]|nr:hypothetical protein [Cytophaga sp.]
MFEHHIKGYARRSIKKTGPGLHQGRNPLNQTPQSKWVFHSTYNQDNCKQKAPHDDEGLFT